MEGSADLSTDEYSFGPVPLDKTSIEQGAALKGLEIFFPGGQL